METSRCGRVADLLKSFLGFGCKSDRHRTIAGAECRRPSFSFHDWPALFFDRRVADLSIEDFTCSN
jgi:hypothetical protein